MKEILERHHLSAILFCNLSEHENKNMLYYSGYSGIGCLFLSGKKSFLLVPKMEYTRAQSSSTVRVIAWKKGKRMFDALREILKKKKIVEKKIGLDYQELPAYAYLSLKKSLKVKTKDISKDCLEGRSVKSKKEISLLKKSCAIASAIMEKCIRNIKRFKTEQDVAHFLLLETIRQGCTLAFPSIVASGKGAGMPHYEPQNVPLRKGFCVIDFGVNYKGYHSDVTRTAYLGKPNKKEKELYAILLQTHKKLISSIQLNKLCKDSHEECVILLGKYAKNFTHGLGHGIGLQIHELPNLHSLSTDRFKNGMVFTIEPGIYFQAMGMRIEDDILIEHGKVKVLTDAPYETL